MKKMPMLFAIVLLAAAGCRAKAVSPAAAPPDVPTAPVLPPTLTPTQPPAPADTPAPGPDTPGKITGILFDQSTGKGFPEVELCLFPYDTETNQADPPLMPSVFSDARGVFLFEDIPPGHYFLFSMTWKSSWDDPSGAMHIFELLPDGTTDLGQISVDH